MYLLGNYSHFIPETGQMYQNKKVDLSYSKFHYAVVHAITFYGTLVVICTLFYLLLALSESLVIEGKIIPDCNLCFKLL